MNKVIGTKSHPDSPSFNTKLFSDFARFVLPVWNLLDALTPLIREIHQHDACRHQNLPLTGLRTECQCGRDAASTSPSVKSSALSMCGRAHQRFRNLR